MGQARRHNFHSRRLRRVFISLNFDFKVSNGLVLPLSSFPELHERLEGKLCPGLELSATLNSLFPQYRRRVKKDHAPRYPWVRALQAKIQRFQPPSDITELGSLPIDILGCILAHCPIEIVGRVSLIRKGIQHAVLSRATHLDFFNHSSVLKLMQVIFVLHGYNPLSTSPTQLEEIGKFFPAALLSVILFDWLRSKGQ